MRIHITLLFVLITGTMLFGHSSGLSCWVCSSLVDNDCTDDSFSRLKNRLNMKKGCDEVPAISLPDRRYVPRTVPATRCVKLKVKIHDMPVITRSCASPGEYDHFFGLGQNFIGCTTDEGDTICMCNGDYCNGTATSTFTIHLAIFSLLACIII